VHPHSALRRGNITGKVARLRDLLCTRYVVDTAQCMLVTIACQHGAVATSEELLHAAGGQARGRGVACHSVRLACMHTKLH
jgi:hypothetical protein